MKKEEEEEQEGELKEKLKEKEKKGKKLQDIKHPQKVNKMWHSLLHNITQPQNNGYKRL